MKPPLELREVRWLDEEPEKPAPPKKDEGFDLNVWLLKKILSLLGIAALGTASFYAIGILIVIAGFVFAALLAAIGLR